MTIPLLLDMAASEFPERIAVAHDDIRWSVAQLDDLASGAAGVLHQAHVRHVAYVGLGGPMLPLLTFAAARAALPFTPLNYRLGPEAIRDLIARLPEPLVVVDAEYRDIVSGLEHIVESAEIIAAALTATPPHADVDPADTAIVLFTSGTTSRPKAVELTHNNLTSYVMGTVEFGSAAADDASLICLPPYHIAGVGAALTNLYAGRTMVYLPQFEAHRWLQLIREEGVTTATVVPTMLDRIVDALEAAPVELPTLRNLAYGGAKAALPLVTRALQLLPGVGFTNAYGLTETSSTIAVLTPDDHRRAQRSSDPGIAARLRSVGRVVPGVDVQIRRPQDGSMSLSGQPGELFVRGEQVSGRYAGMGSVLDDEGWFPTKDHAYLDDEGYLFIVGRSDDTIIRGGENIAPAEIEDVLIEHHDVRDVAVIGVDDEEWGQLIVAVVVPASPTDPDPETLRSYVRGVLRGSRTPDRIVFRAQLPISTTGKVLRRELVAELSTPGRRGMSATSLSPVSGATT